MVGELLKKISLWKVEGYVELYGLSIRIWELGIKGEIG